MRLCIPKCVCVCVYLSVSCSFHHANGVSLSWSLSLWRIPLQFSQQPLNRNPCRIYICILHVYVCLACMYLPSMCMHFDTRADHPAALRCSIRVCASPYCLVSDSDRNVSSVECVSECSTRECGHVKNSQRLADMWRTFLRRFFVQNIFCG